MKAPELKDLSSAAPQDAFSKKVESVQASLKEQTEEMQRKTFSLPQQHIDYINRLSLEIGRERGKSVSASEVLRRIIDEHQGIK
jgi:hypothetical protein